MGEKAILENNVIVDYTLRGDNDYDIVVTHVNPVTGQEEPFTSSAVDIPVKVTAVEFGDLMQELRKWKIQHEMTKNILKIKLAKSPELNLSMDKDGILIVKRNNDVELFRVEKKPATTDVFLIKRSSKPDKEIGKRQYMNIIDIVAKTWITKSI